MPSRWPPEKRESCQTIPIRPSLPAAIVPRFAASRIGAPVSGSVAPRACTCATTTGADHVVPRSVERIAISTAEGSNVMSRRVNEATSVPSGSTTIWLLIVCRSTPGSNTVRGGSQLAPPSVVRANTVGPRLPSRRSQIAYA